MGIVELTPEALEAAARTLEGIGPVMMVNLLLYRTQAEYADGTALPPCSGKEAYFGRYVPAFAKVAEQVVPVVASPAYAAEAAPHRRAALADWRFVAATKTDLPG